MKTKNYKLKLTHLICLLIVCLSIFILPQGAIAGPTSTTYEIKEYSFGAGGTGASGITGASNYTMFGTAGEVEYGKLNGASNYSIGGGLIYTLQASVSAAPTFTNPATNYDRLKFTLNSSVGAADTQYAIAISADNFSADTRYIQTDNTVSSTLAWQTYPQWGGSGGAFVTGLVNNTTYYVKVKARQGNFTESPWSSVSSATTSDPSLTFSLDSNSITFTNLNSGNSYTDSAKTTTLTTSTNAYNGYTVYGKESQALTSPNGTITDFSGTNSSPTTWSGTGFGYNTNDSDLAGGTASRFSGSKYAGFTVNSVTNGDPVADDLGPVQSTAISNEAFTISYRVTGNNLTKAGTYTNTIIYTIVAGY